MKDTEKLRNAGMEIIDIIDKYKLSQKESYIILTRVRDSIRDA